MKLTLFLVLALCVSQTFARCPGTDSACSGHGECTALDKCICHSNFQGVGCSERVCPFSIGWSAVQWGPTPRENHATSTVSAVARGDPTHGYTECGGRGVCDRTSGECQCDPGFEGRGCSRMSCPNGCSDHGTCKYINRMNDNLVSWDSAMTQQCHCDPGYTGYDCSERMCPQGDDPMKRDTADSSWYAKYRFGPPTSAYQASDEVYFEFTDMYGNVWPTRTINARLMTATQIQEALQSLPNNCVPEVEVTLTAGSPSQQVDIRFIGGAGPVPTNSLISLKAVTTPCTVHGCQPFSNGVTGNAVSMTLQTTGGRKLSICSSRGKCDSSSGLCSCESGYYGEDCSKQTTVR
jgi:hypothetical protein